MADNSGYPSKQMKVALARRQAHNKSLQDQNEQLKLENEKLRRENYAIKMQGFKKSCCACGMSAEHACLGTEIGRLYGGAATQETGAKPEEVEPPLPPAAGAKPDEPPSK
ncbi:uncharacterized protein LOC102714424 [Oryza brachyantha]|uniref:BZIP domain-containing protein n=1 Tax=Oryza brachyantha TaxID=4533 RepID=J3L058_ORYBR|nr:uncharacterized protein LOC102714424 [Oryza brachyantha]